MSTIKREGKNDRCVYCDLRKQEARDHVIPLCLFTKPLPPNLITVPVCNICNNEKSKDDDFIRDFLTSDIIGNQSPDANKIFQNKVLKSVRRNSSEIARNALKNVSIEPFYTTAGIYLTDMVTAPIDTDRIERIISRIVRGLYYDARRQRMPDNYSFLVLQYYPWDFARLWQHFEEKQLTLSHRSLGNVFGCGFLVSKEDPFITIWLLSFYERVFFSVSTALRGMDDAGFQGGAGSGMKTGI